MEILVFIYIYKHFKCKSILLYEAFVVLKRYYYPLSSCWACHSFGGAPIAVDFRVCVLRQSRSLTFQYVAPCLIEALVQHERRSDVEKGDSLTTGTTSKCYEE